MGGTLSITEFEGAELTPTSFADVHYALPVFEGFKWMWIISDPGGTEHESSFNQDCNQLVA